MIYSTYWKVLNNIYFLEQQKYTSNELWKCLNKICHCHFYSRFKATGVDPKCFSGLQKKKPGLFQKTFGKTVKLCFVNFVNYQWKAKVSYLVLIKMCSDLAFYLVKPGLVANHSFLWLPMHMVNWGATFTKSIKPASISLCSNWKLLTMAFFPYWRTTLNQWSAFLEEKKLTVVRLYFFVFLFFCNF